MSSDILTKWYEWFGEKETKTNPWAPPSHAFTCGLNRKRKILREGERWLKHVKEKKKPCLYVNLMEREERENF